MRKGPLGNTAISRRQSRVWGSAQGWGTSFDQIIRRERATQVSAVTFCAWPDGGYTLAARDRIRVGRNVGCLNHNVQICPREFFMPMGTVSILQARLGSTLPEHNPSPRQIFFYWELLACYSLIWVKRERRDIPPRSFRTLRLARPCPPAHAGALLAPRVSTLSK